MRRTPDRGAALLLALLLLGLLVGIALALSVSVRLRVQAVGGATAGVAARAHALAALDLALARLDEAAGPTTRVTGTAAFVAPGEAPLRGGASPVAMVWEESGAPLARLSSDVASAGLPSRTLRLVGRATFDEVAVEASAFPLPGVGPTTGWGAYAVFDEGAKLAVRTAAPDESGVQLRSVADGPMAAFGPIARADVWVLRQLVIFEQLRLLAPPSLVRTAFSDLSLEPIWRTGGGRVSGRVNVNTASPVAWHAILAQAGVPQAAERAVRLASDAVAFAAPGKRPGGPFTDLDSVREFLASEIPGDADARTAAWAAVEPLLMVRSDTFRIRAAGQGADASGAPAPAVARVEAVVERRGDAGDRPRFGIRHFRWLGPDDY